jgi:formate hydrogenlyase subunit 3/multisubunit Na+/H+ antiporter MnhD subunit
MLGNVLNLCYNYDGGLNPISLIPISEGLDIGFSVTNVSLIIALIVTFIWLIITVYSNEYFVFSNDKRFFAFKLFSILLVEFIILIIFSKNLISMFLFYQCLIFCLYFFSTYFMYEKDSKASHGFTFSLLASSFFMFLAIVLTYKTTGTTEFSNSGIFSNLSYKRYFALLVLFILSIASIAIFPMQIFFKRLYALSSPVIIMVFVISYGMVNLLILLKVILNIFDFDYYIKNTNNLNLSYILNIVVAVNLIASAIFAVIQNNLKKILIFLFFNQLIFAFFLFLILNQSIDQFIIIIISFILSQTLIFLCLGNINIYLLKSKKKMVAGIFYKLKNTSFLLSFALLNLIGIVPAIGLVEKYMLIENYLIEDFDYNLIIIFANIVLVGVAIIRILAPIASGDKNQDPHDIALARKIDLNISLMVPSFTIAALMFLSFIFFSSITNYLKVFLL